MGENKSLAYDCLNCVLCHWTVEDQKDLPSAVSPELRQKEVQMNFFNQLTSVFNPDLTTILGSPSKAQMQASVGELLPHFWDLLSNGVHLLFLTVFNPAN